VSDPVTYTAVLSVAEETVLFVSRLLTAEQRRRRARRRRRAQGCYRQAVLLLRWFLDGTRLTQLATDNQVRSSTAYRYLHEGIDAWPPPRWGRVGRCWPRCRTSARDRRWHAHRHRRLAGAGTHHPR
jgi:hypothetical protein